jgi:hypothetical protein
VERHLAGQAIKQSACPICSIYQTTTDNNYSSASSSLCILQSPNPSFIFGEVIITMKDANEMSGKFPISLSSYSLFSSCEDILG